MDGKLLEQKTPELEETSVDEQIRDWSTLPIELLSLISSSLFPDDFGRFCCVCKKWKLVPSLPVPRPTQCPIPQSQWLMLYRGCSKMELNFSHPLYKDTYRMDIPELSGALLRCSKDGWLLMSRGKHSVFFFNPFTKAKIDLPDLPHNYYFNAISFSRAPTSSDCMVFGIYASFDRVKFSVISRGEEKWTGDQLEGEQDFHHSPTNPVFYNELVYCLGEDGTLGVFNPKDFSWKAVQNPEKSRHFLFESYLMECDGKLMAVFVGKKGRGVSVYTLDDSKMAWERVYDLGSKMLFVSHAASFSATKVVKGMENKIYFPRFCGKHGVFFSLATHRYESFGSRLSRKDFQGMEEPLHCCWIVPRTETHCDGEALNWLLAAD
ncbi:hypothetical protein RHGRI_024734 [Rhododendron griersonianum]|uniref:F-box protein n=1 Tax=Rhododendron griersonianum TaxID=479676 RepID=A0AAV6J8A3_9ERIC|nr:hypothetical protein RHGRI_024734 [Rhododendron griersonianum]